MNFVCAHCETPIDGEVGSVVYGRAELPLCSKCLDDPANTWEALCEALTRKAVSTMPGPDAPRADVDAWYAKRPQPIPHEAPIVANGPTPVCAACGVIRIGILQSPFCRSCKREIEGHP